MKRLCQLSLITTAILTSCSSFACADASSHGGLGKHDFMGHGFSFAKYRLLNQGFDSQDAINSNESNARSGESSKLHQKTEKRTNFNKNENLAIFKRITAGTVAKRLSGPQGSDESQRSDEPQTSIAKQTDQVLCRIPISDELTQDSIHVYAEQVELVKNSEASFKGNVEICSSQLSVSSDTAAISRSEGSVKAEGNINYINEVVTVKSDKFEASTSETRVKLDKAQYDLTQSDGRGKADAFEVSEENLLVLSDATFTTCPIEQEDWVLSAQTISLSSQEGWGVAKNASIKVNDTPVIFIPYITFPLDDRRTSGFLYPNITSSQKHGVEVKTPWYWNIAPNLDATITPRTLTKRGVQLQTEFRYLTETDQGLLNVEYLNNDSDRTDLSSRHMVHWQHNSQFSDNLRAFVDFTQLSDDAYLSELGSDHHNTTDTQVNQHIEFAYFTNNIDSAFRLQNFEVLGQYPSSYQTLPQLDFSNRNPYKFGAFDVNWFAEISHFSNSQSDINKANRFHFEPNFSYRTDTPAYSFSSELSLLHTSYQQQYHDDLNRNDKHISRTLPKFRLHSQVNFERSAKLFGQLGTQTFEPQLQYLYVPYEDQSDIGLFDSTRLQDDYYGLFRDNRFSGLDRIADANQVTLGATTRFINEQSESLMRVSFGQIFYLDNDHHKFTANDERLNRSNSALAGEIFVHWSKRWYLNANVQYDTTENQISKSNLTLDYRADKYKLAQLNHRRTRGVSGSDIEQIGLVASFPIADKWQFVGGYHRDLTQNRSIDSYAGIQYESCCWAVRLVTRRHINTNLEQLAQLTSDIPTSFDSGISLQLVIKGLNGTGNFDIGDMLQQGIFGYRRPYFLNN